MKLIPACIAFLALLLAGCGSDPLIGTWKAQLSPEQKAGMAKVAGGAAYDATIEFQSDGKVTMRLNGTLAGKADSGTIEGTYKLKGKEIAITITRLEGTEVKDQRPQTAVLSDDGRSFLMPGEIPVKFVKQ
jgi:hypothetical protein